MAGIYTTIHVKENSKVEHLKTGHYKLIMFRLSIIAIQNISYRLSILLHR